MSLSNLIRDLQACVDDGEWERAGAYFDDLRCELRTVLAAPIGPRNAGAIATSVRGLDGALADHDAARAAGALRNLAYYADERTRPSADAGG